MILRSLIRRCGLLRALWACVLLTAAVVGARAQSAAVASRPIPVAGVDLGPAPSSETLTLTVRLRGPEQARASLRLFVDALTTPGSEQYHQWLTPATFAAQFGATAGGLSSVTNWLMQGGLQVSPVGDGQRLRATGTVAQIEALLSPQIHRVQTNGVVRFANTVQPTAPATIAALISDVAGLSTVALQPALIAYTSDGVETLPADIDSLVWTGDLLAQSSGPLLTITGCGANDVSMAKAWKDVLLQAAAQGVTVLASADCGAALPAGPLAILADGSAVSSSELRANWQVATGLPLDGSRAAPDFAVGSVSELVTTLQGLIAETGSPLGAVAPVLYQLAPIDGLFVQPSGVSSQWSPAVGLGTVDLAKLTAVWLRGSAATTSSVAVSASAVVHGVPATFTATVTSVKAGVTPSGTVSFRSSLQGLLGTAVLTANGTASLTTGTLRGGDHGITATYNGDAASAASVSSPVALTVQPESLTLQLTAGTVELGATLPVQVVARTSSGVGQPAARIQLLVPGSAAPMVAEVSPVMSGKGTASFSLTPNVVGAMHLSASCASSDGSYACTGSAGADVTVAKASTQTVMATPSQASSGVTTLKAAISRASTTGTVAQAVSGTVEFFAADKSLGTATVTAAAQASLSATLSGKQQSVHAVYSGDGNFAASTSAVVALANGTVTTTTSLTSTSYNLTYGSSAFTLSSTVNPSTLVSNTAPTGSVAYTATLNGVTTTLGTAQLSSGSATLSVPSLAVGLSYVITATYSGDSNYAGSTNTIGLSVAAAVANLGASLTSSSVGYGNTDTVLISMAFPTGNVNGSVNVTINGQTQSVSVTNGSGSLAFNVPPVGTYSISVACATSANYTCNGPIVLPLTVTRGATATTLTYSGNTSVVGRPVSLTATIASTGNGTATYVFTGTVSFYDNGVPIGMGTVQGQQAVLSVALQGARTHSLTAIYSGDTNWFGSTSPATSLVTVATPPTTGLSSNLATALYSTNIVLTAKLGGPTLVAAAPSGIVTFLDNYNGYVTTLGTAALATNGLNASVSVFTTTGLQTGTHSIYFSYNGDTNFAAAISDPITINITDFNLSFTPSSLSLSKGATASTVAQVVPVNGFAGTVTFSCAVPSSTSTTCAISPTMTSGGGGSVKMTVSTSLTTIAGGRGIPWRGVSAGGGVLALLVWGLPGRRRRLPALLLGLAAIALTLGATGCMTKSSSSAGDTAGTPSGTLQFTITAYGSDGVANERKAIPYFVTVQ